MGRVSVPFHFSLTRSSLQKFRCAAVNLLVNILDRTHLAVFRAIDALPAAALHDLFRVFTAGAQIGSVLLVDVGFCVGRLLTPAHHLFGQLGRHVEIKDERRLRQTQKVIFEAKEPVEVLLPLAVRQLARLMHGV